jgi:hypothetical protein
MSEKINKQTKPQYLKPQMKKNDKDLGISATFCDTGQRVIYISRG